MQIEDFLKKNVEGYLMGDLEKMGKIGVPKRKIGGGVGYPMMSSICAGIELLGGLISPTPFSSQPSAGNIYFGEYWNNCLTPINRILDGMAPMFRNLVRNGLDHTFLTKNGVYVTKNMLGVPTAYVQANNSGTVLVVDCVRFFEDFQLSYETYIKPIVFGGGSSLATTKAEMQSRLDEMDRIYESDAANKFRDYQATHIAGTNLTPQQLAILNGPTVSGMSISIIQSSTYNGSSYP